VLLLATIANAKLLYGDFEGAKTDMDEAWKILDHMTGVDDGVNAAYYGVAAAYFITRWVWLYAKVGWTFIFVLQAKAEYAQYYKNSLLYLACVDIELDVSEKERLLRAHDLGISAFLAGTIYNFGELVRFFGASVENGDRWHEENLLADAPYSRRAGWYTTWMDQKAAVYL
jgi:26S proteasome regulatory subunit N9